MKRLLVPVAVALVIPCAAQAEPTICSAPKIQLCHVPPGNPGNAHAICVASSAEAAHTAHGDYRSGEFEDICDDGIDNDCDGRIDAADLAAALQEWR